MDKKPKFGDGRKPKRYTDLQIMQVVEECKGNVSKAADHLGYNRKYLSTRIAKSEEMKIELVEIRERNVDRAEDKLEFHIYEKDSLPALLEYLKAQGKKRGYGSPSIDVTMKGKMEHSVDADLLNSLVDKFSEKLDNDVEEDES